MCTSSGGGGLLSDVAATLNSTGINFTDPLSVHKPRDQGGWLGAPDPLDLGGWQGKAAAQAKKEADEIKNRPPPLGVQAAKTPDQAALRAAAISRIGGGSSTTMTGPGGVAPSLLSLGKTSLLGS